MSTSYRPLGFGESIKLLNAIEVEIDAADERKEAWAYTLINFYFWDSLLPQGEGSKIGYGYIRPVGSKGGLGGCFLPLES